MDRERFTEMLSVEVCLDKSEQLQRLKISYSGIHGG